MILPNKGNNNTNSSHCNTLWLLWDLKTKVYLLFTSLPFYIALVLICFTSGQTFPIIKQVSFPFDTNHGKYVSLGFFYFGEDLLDLEEGLPLGLRHAKHVEHVAGQGHDREYPEMRLKIERE